MYGRQQQQQQHQPTKANLNKGGTAIVSHLFPCCWFVRLFTFQWKAPKNNKFMRPDTNPVMKSEGLNQLFATKYCIICICCAFVSLLDCTLFYTVNYLPWTDLVCHYDLFSAFLYDSRIFKSFDPSLERKMNQNGPAYGPDAKYWYHLSWPLH